MELELGADQRARFLEFAANTLRHRRCFLRHRPEGHSEGLHSATAVNADLEKPVP
ncbi:hypothetical protein ACIGO9_19770 [Nocardia asteroides]|uniref:hypothetical protein n=1 Tax=Nocardia asteroides TaxID=1824 RepID=UPI0037C84D81